MSDQSSNVDSPPLAEPEVEQDGQVATAGAAAAIVDTADLSTVRFPIDLPGYRGSLEQLIVRAQRGDIDLSTIPVAAITGDYRRLSEAGSVELRDMADFLGLVARLVNLKAEAVLPDPNATAEQIEAAAIDESDAGRRLAEYRLFKAAAEALLAEAAEDGARSFLGMVAADVVPVERLRIPPERLAAAFRAVLERLVEVEPLPVGTVTYSVDEMVLRLRAKLREVGSINFDAVFSDVSSRLEAVAIFLALLELLRSGDAEVSQPDAFGPIVVTSRG